MTKLVRSSLKVADPDVARVQDGTVLQGRAVGATTVQVRPWLMCVRVLEQVQCVMIIYISDCSLDEFSGPVAGAVPSDVIGPGREEHQGGG